MNQLIKGALRFGNEGQFKNLTRAELNRFLKNNLGSKDGFAIIKMDGGGQYVDYEFGQLNVSY